MDSTKPFLLLLCLLIIILISRRIQAQSSSEYDNPPYDCPNTNTTTFASNTTYHTNLNTLFSILSSNAINQTDDGFYNTSVGKTQTQNDTVYGLFLCRGDVTAAKCDECVSEATARALRNCPNQKSYIVWYDSCMLRYSDRYFFSTWQQNPMIAIYNTANVSDQSGFTDILGDTMRQVAEEAANSGGGKKFATKEANVSAFQNVYSLVQCTPDLTALDCDKCLKAVIAYLPDCCYAKRAVKIFTPSCSVWYDLSPFYNQQPSPPSPPPPPPPAPPLTPNVQVQQVPSPPPTGKTQISVIIIVAIVASIVLALVLLFFAYRFIIRRKSKKYNSVPEENVEISSADSLQFDLETIKLATNNFSDDNKLGEGGFGEVFKVSPERPPFLVHSRHVDPNLPLVSSGQSTTSNQSSLSHHSANEASFTEPYPR
ncbi:cysteine-rich receptor-kinase-like protein [Senna tora]|uniref:Cysteine-rich receptor-kinase-like protein n=1 Tax=Senna tora TaxID=362788 RepID=A0A835CI13_9FABA|nr:cysteine-rich receptor-kinase-like protein [Senna tora]